MALLDYITKANYKINRVLNDLFVTAGQLNDVITKVNEHENALDAADIGAAPTPVATRTNNPIIGTNSINANIDALDAAIGADNTAASRTNNPTVPNSTINAKVQALDNAIGADANLTAETRTKGQLTAGSTILTKVDKLDEAIGADASVTGQAKNISTSNSIYANMASIDLYKSVRTIKKTIGAVGLAGMDYNFATAEDMVEQVITLTNIVPEKARILDVTMYTDAIWTNAVTLGVEVGTSSSGNQLIASTDMKAAMAIVATANAGVFIAQPSASASSIYVSATPGANWSAVTAGSLSVYITILDLKGI